MLHKIFFILIVLNFISCSKQDAGSPGIYTQIIRIDDVNAYAITPDGRMWYLRSDRAYLVQKDTIHTLDEILKKEQEERDKVYQQNQYYPSQPLLNQNLPTSTDQDTSDHRTGLAKLLNDDMQKAKRRR